MLFMHMDIYKWIYINIDKPVPESAVTWLTGQEWQSWSSAPVSDWSQCQSAELSTAALQLLWPASRGDGDAVEQGVLLHWEHQGLCAGSDAGSAPTRHTGVHNRTLHLNTKLLTLLKFKGNHKRKSPGCVDEAVRTAVLGQTTGP